MKFKIGDKVRVTGFAHADENKFFNVGDVGVIVDVVVEVGVALGQVFIDFNNQGNSSVYSDGFWYTYESHLELVDAELANTTQTLQIVYVDGIQLLDKYANGDNIQYSKIADVAKECVAKGLSMTVIQRDANVSVQVIVMKKSY